MQDATDQPGAEEAAGLGLAGIYSLQAEHGLVQQKLLAEIQQMEARTPLIIQLNEAHLAPLTAWKFIHYLGERLSQSRILMIVSLRQDGNATGGTPLPVYADILQRMNREGLFDRLNLQRFDDNDLRKLMHAMFPFRDFSGDFFRLVGEISGGIPGKAVHCLHQCMEAGVVFERRGVWFSREGVSRQEILDLTGDKSQREEADKLLAGLDARVTELVEFAALMKEPFSHHLLAAAVCRSRPKVLKELLFLCDHKLLLQVDENRYQFRQPEVREALRERCPEATRLQRHRSIAERVEATEDCDPGEKLYALAHHYSKTGEKRNAFRYLRRAGELALENFAFMEARSLLMQALTFHASRGEEKHPQDVAQVFVWVAWLDRILGSWKDSIEHAEEALKWLGESGSGQLRNQVLMQEGFTYFRLNEWKKAEACFEKCLADKENLSRLDQAMAEYGLGNINFELANYQASYEYYEHVLELAESLQAKQLMANVYNNLGALENIRSHRMRAIALYSRSIPLFKSLGDNFGLARIYHNLGMTHADDENWQQANDFYGQSLLFSDIMGLVPLKSITFLNRALALARLEKFNEAREYNYKAYRILERLNDDLGIAEYHKVQGIIEREQGDWAKARVHLEKALKRFDAKENKLGLAESAYEMGVLALAQNCTEVAVTWFGKALERYRELENPQKVKLIEEQIAGLEETASTSVKE